MLEPVGPEPGYRLPALLGIYAADKARHECPGPDGGAGQATDGTWLGPVPAASYRNRIQAVSS